MDRVSTHQTETLKAVGELRGEVAGLRQGQRDILMRLAQIEEGQVRLRHDQVRDAETVVHLESQVDRTRGDIERINRRLDIVD